MIPRLGAYPQYHGSNDCCSGLESRLERVGKGFLHLPAPGTKKALIWLATGAAVHDVLVPGTRVPVVPDDSRRQVRIQDHLALPGRPDKPVDRIGSRRCLLFLLDVV